MIVNLERRHTSSIDECDARRSSPDSSVFVSGSVSFPDGPGALELFAGSTYYLPADSRRHELPATGVKLRPGQAIIVESSQDVRLPLNVSGLLLGKGGLILHGIIVSPGKIDPGFSGKLMIALFNGGTISFEIKPKVALCNCIFLQVESDSRVLGKTNPQPVQQHRPPFRARAAAWIVRNKDILVTIMAFVAILISLIGLMVKHADS